MSCASSISAAPTTQPTWKRDDYATLEQLRGKDWDYLESMKLTYEDDELGVVFVHGGFLPGRPWQKQPARIVTRIQVVGRDGEPHKRAEEPDAPHWSELWNGPPFVVYGHTPRDDVSRTKWTLGIDTACVMGGSLTAYILPEKRVVQVKARGKRISGRRTLLEGRPPDRPQLAGRPSPHIGVGLGLVAPAGLSAYSP